MKRVHRMTKEKLVEANKLLGTVDNVDQCALLTSISAEVDPDDIFHVTVEWMTRKKSWNHLVDLYLVRDHSGLMR